MKMIHLFGHKKPKTFTDSSDLTDFIVVNGGDQDDVTELCHLLKKGQAEVYWCHNPYTSEIHDDTALMWNTCKDSLGTMHSVYAEEI